MSLLFLVLYLFEVFIECPSLQCVDKLEQVQKMAMKMAGGPGKQVL